MKKFILFFVFVVASVVLASCTSTDEVGNFEKISGVEVKECKTLEALEVYNDTLLAQCARTRGGGRLCVAAKDIQGAVAGIIAGKTLAGLAGLASGGIASGVVVVGLGLINGAAASYTAHKRHSCTYAVETSEFFDFAKNIVDSRFCKEVVDSSMLVKDLPFVGLDKSSNQTSVRINLPEEYSYLRTLGADHNAILLAANVDGDLPASDGVSVHGLQQVQLKEEEMEAFNNAVNSPEFEECFYSTIEDVMDGKSLRTLETCPDRVKKALQSYLDLFQAYPENVDELVEIANGYIKIIEKNKEFTKDEKDLIYAAIMVSVYSPQLWDNFK